MPTRNRKNIILLTWGSMGDVHPFLALGRRLAAGGHGVRLCASSRYRPHAEALGLDFHPVGPPLTPELMSWAMEGMLRSDSFRRQVEFLMGELLLHESAKHFADSLAACEGFDLAICHTAAVFSQEAAMVAGLPWIGALFCPLMVQTAHRLPMSRLSLGRVFNRLMWKAALRALDMRLAGAYRRKIRALGGRRRDFRMADVFSAACNLIGASPVLAPVQPDLPQHFHVTGRWFLDEPHRPMPPRLREFLDAGPPPVVFSFGSMGTGLGEQISSVVLDAIRRVGCRAVVQRGWAELAGHAEPAKVHFAEYVPHQLLFTRASCVVMHGGAGVSHAVARAGVPAVVVPHLMDQFYWGRRLYDLGVSPRPLRRGSFTGANLAARIHECLASRAMAARARALAEQVRSERGLDRAVAIIEQFA